MSGKSGVSVKIDGLAAVRAKLAHLDADVMTTVSQKLRAVALRMFGEIMTRSPVDSGRYKGGWSAPDIREGRNVVTMRITNNVKYAHPVTYGSEAGKRPWPSAGPRTVKQGSRVYSRQAPGGVVAPIFEGWADEVVEEIRDGLRNGLK